MTNHLNQVSTLDGSCSSARLRAWATVRPECASFGARGTRNPVSSMRPDNIGGPVRGATVKNHDHVLVGAIDWLSRLLRHPSM